MLHRLLVFTAAVVFTIASVDVVGKSAAKEVAFVANAIASGAVDSSAVSAARRAQSSYDILIPGQTMLESVYSMPGSQPWATYHYFALPVDASLVAAGGFRLIVSNLDANKDVDIFVSYNAFPTNATFDFESISTLAEILDINQLSQPSFQTNLTCPMNVGSECFYYIAVSPYTAGQHFFSILAVPFDAVMPISDGVPIDGSQVLGSSGYYSFNFFSNVREKKNAKQEAWHGARVGARRRRRRGMGQGARVLLCAKRSTWKWVYDLTVFTRALLFARASLAPCLTPPPPTSPQSTGQSLTISLLAFYGQPLLTLNLTSVTSGSGYAYYSLTGSTAGSYLTISLLDPQFASACPLGTQCIASIAVLGSTDTQFQLTAATAGSITMLGESLEISRAVAANATAYFSYAPSCNGTITFAVTPLSGIPLIAASVTNSYPTPGTSGWAPPNVPGALTLSPNVPGALALSPQIIEINTTDNSAGNQPCAPACSIYYVSVTAARGEAATFSIIATTAPFGAPTSIPLTDGIAVPGVAPPHLMTFFTFITSLPAVSIDFYAFAGTGDVDVYVNWPQPGNTSADAFPSPFCFQQASSGACTFWGAAAGSYRWSSVISQTSGIATVPALATVPVGTLLTVGVLATPPDAPDGTPPPASLVYVTAATGAAPIVLLGGIPQSASLDVGVARYYSFPPPSYGQDIIIVADVADGHISLYVSEAFGLSDPNTFPGPALSSFIGQPSGSGFSTYNVTDDTTGIERSKSVYIPFTSLSPRCVFAVLVGSGACQLAIAIVGSARQGTATFAVTATGAGSPSFPLRIIDGGSLYSIVPQGGCAFVLAMVSGAGTPTAYVNVQNIVGASTLYVNVGDRYGFYSPGQGAPADYVSADVGGFERMRIETNSSTPLFITVCTDVSGTVGPTSLYVDFHTGARVVQLGNGIPISGSLGLSSETAYYSFTNAHPLSDVMVGLDRTFGGVDVWIIVASPSQPWMLPGPNNFMWAWSPSFSLPSYNISHTQSNACVPTDIAPCVYMFALTTRFNASAAYIITASHKDMPITSLVNGEPVQDSVSDGSYKYYLFQPSGAGVPTPFVFLEWTNMLGNVVAYVTNTWIPGVSDSSTLPGKGSPVCQWICTNFTGCQMGQGDSCYLPAAASGGPIVYTIAISGATNTPAFISHYQLAAVVQGSPQLLQVGYPTSDIFLPGMTNVTFGFVLESLADVSIVASVAHGSVTMMVAHDSAFGSNSPPPGCAPTASGTRTICSGYTWLVATGIGEPALYINASSPCNPVVPPNTALPLVDPGCASDSDAFTTGHYWVTLYSNDDLSELSLLVNSAYRPIPTVPLADGAPQVVQSATFAVCPGASRDPTDGACNTADPVYPTIMPSGALFWFQQSGLSSLASTSLMVERLCNGNYSGDCGAPLAVYLKGCVYDDTSSYSCLVPYHDDSLLKTVIFDSIGAIDIPDGLCLNATSAPGASCIYSAGIYPLTGGGVSPLPPGPPVPYPLPGIGAPPALFRVTLSTAEGIQRVPSDCPGNGRVCTLPPQSVAAGYTRRYEAYSGSSDGVTPDVVTIVGSLCYGQTVTLSACYLGGSCYTPNNPGGAGEADATATSNANGIASLIFQNPISSRGVYWIGAAATGASAPGVFAPPIYSLSLQHGSGWTLALDPLAAGTTAQWSDASTLVIAWGQAILMNPEAYPASRPALGAAYIIRLFPFGGSGQWALGTPCGARGAKNANLSIAEAHVRDGSLSTSFINLPNAYTYMVTVSVLCDSRDCLPLKEMALQEISFTPVATDKIPTPMPMPSASPMASPSSSPSGGSGVISPQSSVSAAAVVSIVGVLAAGAALFFAYRKFGSALAGYSAVPGGSLSSGARTGLSTHPIFGGNAESEPSTDYGRLDA